MNRKILGTIAASSALGIGIGLQRSQFAVLGEIMASKGWIINSEIGILSGISLIGYLLGCLHQTRLKNEINNIKTIRIGLALAVMTFFIEPLLNSLEWQMLWRLICGWASAQLVAGIPGLATKFHTIDEKRLSLAYIFAGAGFAALIASTLVSKFSSETIIEGWIITGVVALILAIPIHMLLDTCIEEEISSRQIRNSNANTDEAKITDRKWPKGLKLLASSAFCFGAAQVTVMTYYPLLLISRFNVTQELAAESFSNVGLGYMVGAIAAGYMPKKLSTDFLMTSSAFIGITGSLLCSAGTNIPVVAVGAFAFAMWNGSMMGLLLNRINQSVATENVRAVWSKFSMILSAGFLIFIMASSSFANKHVESIIWMGLFLVTAHLILQVMAKNAFAKSSAS